MGNAMRVTLFFRNGKVSFSLYSISAPEIMKNKTEAPPIA